MLVLPLAHAQFSFFNVGLECPQLLLRCCTFMTWQGAWCGRALHHPTSLSVATVIALPTFSFPFNPLPLPQLEARTERSFGKNRKLARCGCCFVSGTVKRAIERKYGMDQKIISANCRSDGRLRHLEQSLK